MREASKHLWIAFSLGIIAGMILVGATFGISAYRKQAAAVHQLELAKQAAARAAWLQKHDPRP